MGLGKGKQPRPQVVGDRQNHRADVAGTERWRETGISGRVRGGKGRRIAMLFVQFCLLNRARYLAKRLSRKNVSEMTDFVSGGTSNLNQSNREEVFGPFSVHGVPSAQILRGARVPPYAFAPPLSIYFLIFCSLLLFPFFLFLFTLLIFFYCLVHPIPFYQNRPIPFPGVRS